VAGCSLLCRLAVAAAIRELVGEAAQRAAIHAEAYLRHRAICATAPITAFVESDAVGTVRWRPSDEIPRERAACVQEISTDAKGRLKYSFRSNLRRRSGTPARSLSE
jgi:hypothetical protein